MRQLEVDDRMTREHLEDIVQRRRLEAEAHPAPVDPQVSHAGQRSELGTVDRLRELDGRMAIAPARHVGDVLDGDQAARRG